MESKYFLTCLLLMVVTCAVYLNSLDCEFTFDDNSAIVSNRNVHSNETTWWSVFAVDYWGTPIQSEHSHKSYRPLTLLTFRWNHFLFDLKPLGYHLTNVLLHLLVSFICYRMMLNLLQNDNWPAFLMTLFFAVHPLKSEAVSGIVGRAELLCTFFFLMALFCYFDKSYISFTLHTVLATLSKEQGLTVPCVCIVFELILLCLYYKSLYYQSLNFMTKLVKLLRHGSTIRIALLTVFVLALVGARFAIMGGTLPVFTKFDNPASFEDTPTRQLTYNYLVALNAKLMLYPIALCADWTMNSVPLVRQIEDSRNLATVTFYLVLLALIIRAVKQIVNFQSSVSYSKMNKFFNESICLPLALSLTIIPFIPASNLLFPVGFVIAERVLYTPSIGYSLLLAIGFIRLRDFVHSKWFTRLLYFFALITIASLATRAYIRNFDWKNDLTLFESGLKVNENNAKLYNNIGHYYERNHNYEKAMHYFHQAALKDIEDIGSELNIARTLIHLNRLAEAEKLLWTIKPKVRHSAIRSRIVPHYLNLWINLARVISLDNSRLSEAENLYHEVIAIRRDFIDAYINLGEIYIRRAQYDSAIDVYKQALSRVEFKNDLKVADLYYNIGIARTLLLNNLTESQKYSSLDRSTMLANIAQDLSSAIDINYNHKEALINLAILVQKPAFPHANQTYYREYILKALQAYTKKEEQEVIEFNIAITLLDLGGPSNRLQAIEHLKRAVKIMPNFRSALYNLALLYYDFKEYDSALRYLKQLFSYHPSYSKGLLLMADIYSRIGQFSLAEEMYAKVLDIDHNNYEARHNLNLILKRNHKV